MGAPYRFGSFTLDPVKRQLCADGQPVPLGPTAFHILQILVEGAGAAIPKEELISRVWGHSDVGDNRLHVHINALRKIVGQGRIVTKQGRGYHFVTQFGRSRTKLQLQTGETRPGNLPSLWMANEGSGRLIGRAVQLRAVSKLLASSRLVTLTGPGGVGKTRLALQAAWKASPQFSDGVWLVELAALKDPDATAGAVAAVLGIKVGDGAAPLDTLARVLARKTLLIVLDNCEHVIGAAARLCETLLGATQSVKILATSREAFCCPGEQAFEVPPLEVPPESVTETRAMRAMASVELFTERAKSAGSNFRLDDEDVLIAARICRRLDGLPLAIEIVAGWAGVLGLETLDAEFDGSMQAWPHAGNTTPPRHATLRATLQWSYDLLSATERTVLRRLAVFAGAFTLEAAKAVVGDSEIPEQRVFEHVGRMIRRSMVVLVPEARRYRLLETTRAFMLERLAESAEAEVVRSRHARYLLRLLERATDEWETTSDTVWLHRYAPVLDDLRSALDWATAKEPDTAVALGGASWPLWREVPLLVEGRERLSAAVALLHRTSPPALEARLRYGLGNMMLNTTATKAAHAECARAAMLYRSIGEALCLGQALTGLGYVLMRLGRMDEAEKAVTEALELLEHSSWPRTLATAYAVQLGLNMNLGQHDAARAAGEKSLQLCELVGADRSAFVAAANLMQLSFQTNDLDSAISAGRELAARFRDTCHTDVLGYVLGLLAGALTARGDLDEALTAARQAAPLLRDEGMLFWLFDHFALRAGLAGQMADAARFAGYADAAYRKHDEAREPIAILARERLNQLLRQALQDAEIAQLNHEGSLFIEEQAMTLALQA